jgi:glycolate oxidase iron-sulfur subunit
VAFFTGCVMSTLLSPLDEATVRVLLASGCELVTPKNQVCCGALHVHNGEINIAKKLARKNIDAFSRFDFEAVVVNSAGCGALLKNYSELLSDDQKYAKKAVEFSAKVKDVSEFLTSLDLRNNLSREIKAKVTYQEPCHLANVQKVRNQPRSLIQSIPGIEYVEMKNADRCCGAGGNYFLKHHDESMKMLDEKMANVKETGADIVVTSNPPCYIQLLYGVKKTGQKVKVMHLVELLDQALTRQ